MLYSMTGYGEASFGYKGYNFKIELVSLNSRFLDVIYSMPDFLERYQVNIKKNLEKYFHRGRITVRVKFKVQGKKRLSEINWDFLRNFVEHFEKKLPNSRVTLSLDLQSLFRLPQFQSYEDFDTAEFRKKFLEALDKAARALKESRKNEGSKIEKIFTEKLNTLEKEIKTIRELKAKEKENKMKEAMENGLQEEEISAMLAKIDVEEEVDRFESHINYFRRVLKNKKRTKGRELEFVIQEMHRELTTISQKSISTDVIRKTIRLRNIVEQLREQVRNVE